MLWNQFGNLTFFWRSAINDKSLRFQFTWQSLFLNASVSENAFCCIFSLFWFIPLGLIKGKKTLVGKYVLLCQAGLKQKCFLRCGEKKSFFTISKTSGWLLRRSALKSHLLITYMWFYVGLASFPWKKKNKNYADLGGCLLRSRPRWISSSAFFFFCW